MAEIRADGSGRHSAGRIVDQPHGQAGGRTVPIGRWDKAKLVGGSHDQGIRGGSFADGFPGIAIPVLPGSLGRIRGIADNDDASQ